MSVVSSTSDLPIKYQRLAAEYAKLRAQVPVLKNAVLEERKTSETLNEKVREDEQKRRKLESEVESLVFRNDQLTKRVEFLQEKLQEATNPAFKKRASKMTKSQSNYAGFHASQQNNTDSIIAEELDRKLRENTDLHTKIFELEATHERELQGVMEKMSVLEKENHNLNQELHSIQSDNQCAFLEICKEKNKLFDKIKRLEGQIDRHRENNTVVDTTGASVNGVISTVDSYSNQEPVFYEPNNDLNPFSEEENDIESEEQQNEFIVKEDVVLVESDDLVGRIERKSQENDRTCLKEEIQINLAKIVDLEKEKDKLKVELQFLKVKNDVTDKNIEVDAQTLESFYSDRVGELVEELQLVSGKCLFLQSECLDLIALVQEKHENCKQLRIDLQESMEKIKNLNEELETTRANYETQMSSLTEHLAQMDEKILQQSDVIANLKAGPSSKANGSTKRKFF